MAHHRNLLAEHFGEEIPVEPGVFSRVFADVVAPLLARLRQMSRLMCGVPDYDTYIQHMQTIHPDWEVPTYEEFFKECQNRRFGGGMQARCC